MTNYFLSTLLLAPLIIAELYPIPQSPCPENFWYFNDQMEGHIMGMVIIPVGQSERVQWMLRVSFNYPTVLPKVYNTELEIVDLENVHASPVQRAESRNKFLYYRIRFPIQQPLPFLKEIIFNNRYLCRGPDVNWPIISVIDYKNDNGNPDFPVVNSRFNKPSNNDIHPSYLPVSSTTVPSVQRMHKQENCGLSKTANITIGVRTRRHTGPFIGRWPWLTAIFTSSSKFKCTGNLISERHVITAAHCLKNSGTVVLSREVYVLLGKYILEEADEYGSLRRDVSDIRIHPNSPNTDSRNADSDLAILILDQQVKYSLTIQPLCLWNGPNDIEEIVGQTGVVVGWGESGKLHPGEFHETTAEIVTEEECWEYHSNFIIGTSNRTFCAKYKEGEGICRGYSGSGFIMQNPEDGRYYLRGLVSLTRLLQSNQSCVLNEYIVYVDTAKYQDWIGQQISGGSYRSGYEFPDFEFPLH